MSKPLYNLYFMPCLPSTKSGYGIAVESDLKHYIKYDPNNIFIFIIDGHNNIEEIKKKFNINHCILIKRNNIFFRLSNLFSTGHPGFFSGFLFFLFLIIKLKTKTFKYVFIGDVNFFYVSKYINCSYIEYRLHNLYLKMIKNIPLIWDSRIFIKVFYEAYIGSHIEMKIIDKIKKTENNNLLLITDAERDFLQVNYKINCSTLPVSQAIDMKISHHTNLIWDKKLIWFGGLSSHKELGINYFIKYIYPDLLNTIPDLEFHLFGKGSLKFNMPRNNIYGHGYVIHFNVENYRNSIFINPDIIGGGIKLKLLFLYSNGLTCLSTPLGVEGFDNINDWKELKILNINDWNHFFKKYSLANSNQ